LVTLFVVFVAFQTIKQRDDQEIRDRKQLVLETIVNWAIEIRSAPMRKEFVHTDSHIIRTKNTLLAYSIPLSRKVYIRALAIENFKGSLLTFVDNTIEALSAFIYIQYIEIKDKNPLELLKIETSIIERIEKELTISPNDLITIIKTYDTELNNRIDSLFEKVANIISDL